MLPWSEIRGLWEAALEEVPALITSKVSIVQGREGSNISHAGKHQHGLDPNSLLPKTAVRESELERQS